MPIRSRAVTVTFLTSLAFMALVFLSGFIANSLIAAVEARQSLTPSLLNGASPSLSSSRPLAPASC